MRRNQLEELMNKKLIIFGASIGGGATVLCIEEQLLEYMGVL